MSDGLLEKVSGVSRNDINGYIDPNWRCSKCGGKALVDPYWGLYDLVGMCPQCKAKMEYKKTE